jgi:glycosyltransferase involved in cell wall biosynthesis
LLVTHIPVYMQGQQAFTDANWQRDVLLARDWLAAPFGPLILLCPSLPFSDAARTAWRLVPIGGADRVRVVPSFDLRCRARQFWVVQRRQWMDDVRRELHSARIVHCSAADVFRPLWYLAHRAAVQAGKTTVLVGPDMDPHLILPRSMRGRLQGLAFDQLMKRAMRRADLVLLKAGAVHARYAAGAPYGVPFCHSTHHEQDVIAEQCLEIRLAMLQGGRPLKAVYAGRFIPPKGLLDALGAVASARQKGVMVEFHLFGSGPEEPALRRRVVELGLSDLVHFHGCVDYDAQFFCQLAQHDVLLFLPTEEDTPRMLFDAMAAGLPLVGSRVPFLEYRARMDGIGVLVNVGDSAGAGDQLCRLSAQRDQLAALSRAAAAAGHQHAIEHWYRRRAEWTQDAAARKQAGR